MRQRYFSRKAIKLHVTLILSVSAFLALAYWQFRRALSGNTLSWLYSFEWPFFAGYACYLWYKLLHNPQNLSLRALIDGDDIKSVKEDRVDRSSEEEDPELEEYNRYLSYLAKKDEIGYKKTKH